MSKRIYESAENYFEGPDSMKNEVMMWFVAGGLLAQEVSKKIGNAPFGGLKGRIGYEERKRVKNIRVLDFCSGPGNFVNHLAFVMPEIKVVCVDMNANFIRTGNEIFKKWKFIEEDVTTVSLKTKFPVITASSAYHHIEDKNKIKFLKNIRNHLTSDGIVLMCENFLPDYYSDKNRKTSVNKYYTELARWYHDGNSTKEAVLIIKEVKEQELAEEVEHKVSFRIFKNHLKKSGLRLNIDIPVWQPQPFIADNAGSHVVVLKKTKITGRSR